MLSTLTTMSAAVLLLCGGGDGKPEFRVRLKATAVTRGVEIQVGDLADIEPVGKDALAISRISFAPAPSFGYARTVTRTELLQSLVLAGHPAESFEFAGPAEVVVQAATTELSAAELAESSEAVLRAALAESGEDIEAELTTRTRHILAPPGRASLEIVPRVRRQIQWASAIVDVDIMVDEGRWKTIPLQYRLTRYAPVVKTVGPIRKGTLLGPDNLEIAREKRIAATDFLAHRIEDVAGMVARRDLQAGRPLRLVDFGPPAIVRRGDLVTVVLTKGRVKVTAKALVAEDASQGAPVTVVNPNSGAKIRGIAAAPGLVVVGN
ncbi:MAG: hypothetical protein Fur0037_05610 [Planctomycetota bacterium]